MTVEEMAKIIEAEASVLPYEGKLGVAQCIRDLNYNAAAFTTPYPRYSASSLKAAKAVKEQGESRISGAKIIKLRSFTNYSDGHGNPDYAKIRTGKDPIPETMDYLGKDYKDNTWGQFYFGTKAEESDGKMFKMLLIAGHGDGDSGACGCGLKESDLTRELVSLIKKEADANGVNCTVADTSKNYYKYLKAGGAYDFKPYNYVLEVHFNHRAQNGDSASNGVVSGSMFYLHENERNHHSVEDKILSNLYAIGSRKAWDGVVMSTAAYAGGLLVQNRVESQGVSHGLLETLFISDPDDMALWGSKRAQIASAIIKGIADGFGLKTSSKAPNFTPYTVKVTDPALNIRKSYGVGNPVVGCITDQGVYTIVAEGTASEDGATWGKLKSGAGWINLNYTKRC